ncbi:MAG: hypothetical protein ACYC1M_10315 [Armatimonadota bacterium]
MAKTIDTMPDTWAATDALGRSLLTAPKVPAPRTGKAVGMFYFLWLDLKYGPYDISKALAKDPNAVRNADSPVWGSQYSFHQWGESIYGYYLNTDTWVLRRHATMLSDAGIDVVIFDVTNNVTYPESWKALAETWTQMRKEGLKTPQIAFLCPFGDPTISVMQIWTDLYSKGLYKDLWYMMDGKPLILADLNSLVIGLGNGIQNTPDALKPGMTLAQSFKATEAFVAVSARSPNWDTKGSGYTMKLFSSPSGVLVAQQKITNIGDNVMVTMVLPNPAPAGDYIMQISDPVGTIGWWSHTDDVYKDGQAYANGQPVPGDRAFRVDVANSEASKIRSFFTARKPMPSMFDGPSGPDQWSWLEMYPQHMFKNSKGECEMMSVGAAQNGADGKVGSMSDGDRIHGRTWHNGARDTSPGAVNMGFNLAEQFEHAIKEDPDFIFVTGWNEWMALRLPEFLGVQKPVIFVDTFNHEYSRDIEPMVGGHTDSYYYQMVNYIRQFKGARAVPKAGREVSIGTKSPWSAWQKVQPTYLDAINETLPRDHDGIGKELHYTDHSGRNDLRVAKVARDAKNLVFYVQTTNDISPRTGSQWMQLFISTGTGPAWEGFEYAVNRVSPGSKAVLEVCQGGWKWRKLADVDYKLQGNQLMITIPRKLLGLAGNRLNLQFKWADNCLKDGDILTAWTNGDTAPTGRARYIYQQ